MKLRQGRRGEAVRTLQSDLTAAGFPVGPIDGIFGAATDEAVRSFQSAHGLMPDGIVGPRTAEMLRAVLAASAGATANDGDDDGAASSRPSSRAMASAYADVDYRKSAEEFLKDADPKIRKTFENNGWVNTCAARLTVALIEAGHGIPSRGYLDSQGRRWMASARSTRDALTRMWGPPDRTLTSSEEVDETVQGLASGQVAVFAGQGHVGILKPGYRDPYVRSYVPVDVWALAP